MVRTIKYIQMLLILAVVFVSTASQADYSRGFRGPGDDTHPWPWGFEVKFPWNDVQGIWRMQKDDKALFFSFRRVQAKRIKVKQIDMATCDVVGTGQGLEKDKTIVAQIRNTDSNETYNLTIYAFNEEDLEPPILSQVGSEHVIVARINSLDRLQAEFAAQMVRISDRLEVKCGDQDKKTRF